MGQFVTGDYYVVGPVTIVSITPEPVVPAVSQDAPILPTQADPEVEDQTSSMGLWLALGAGAAVAAGVVIAVLATSGDDTIEVMTPTANYP